MTSFGKEGDIVNDKTWVVGRLRESFGERKINCDMLIYYERKRL